MSGKGGSRGRRKIEEQEIKQVWEKTQWSGARAVVR